MKTGQKFVPCVPHEFSYRLKVLHGDQNLHYSLFTLNAIMKKRSRLIMISIQTVGNCVLVKFWCCSNHLNEPCNYANWMESHACSCHPVLVNTAKIKATSVAVEQQTLFGWRTAAVWHDCNLEIETYMYMSKQVSKGREQLVPLPYKTQEVTMCFENGLQTRTTRQERSKRPTLHTQHWDPQACSGGTLSPGNASFWKAAVQLPLSRHQPRRNRRLAELLSGCVQRGKPALSSALPGRCNRVEVIPAWK